MELISVGKNARTSHLATQEHYEARTNSASLSCAEDVLDLEPASLLTLPFELRSLIYDYVKLHMDNSTAQRWYEMANTTYDSLRLVCRQLCAEMEYTILQFRATQHIVAKLCNIPTNRINLEHANSLCFEINHNQIPQLCTGLAATIDNVQQSLQELKIVFVGRDRNGVQTGMRTCGNIVNSGDGACLLETRGQHCEALLPLWRRVTILKNLKVLVIRNANCPIFPSIILAGKPQLECVHLDTDPRSLLHKFEMMRNKPGALHNLMQQHQQVYASSIKALHTGSNAVLGAVQVVNRVMPNLEHLTWSQPHHCWQSSSRTAPKSYLAGMETINDIQHILAAIRLRGSQLKTLRICATTQTHGTNWMDSGSVLETLTNSLPTLLNLEVLELHTSCSSRWATNDFISNLPNNLRRLYIADSCLESSVLVEQIERRYFSTVGIRKTLTSSLPSCPWSERMPIQHQNHPRSQAHLDFDQFISPAFDDTAENTTDVDERNVYATLRRSASEGCDSMDWSVDHLYHDETQTTYPKDHYLDMSRGALGFIGYEYHSDFPEELRMDLMRMNGRLLDREHNLHLANLQQKTEAFQQTEHSSITTQQFLHNHAKVEESAAHSSYLEIAVALNELYVELAPSPSSRQQNLDSLDMCSLESIPGFGNENEAIQVFVNEPVAKIESMTFKSTVMDVPLTESESKRCHWNSPEYQMTPRSSWPVPKLPKVIEPGITEKAVR